MRIEEFLCGLRELDVRIRADGERLRCEAPAGVLTPDLRARLAERKAEILLFLRQSGLEVPTYWVDDVRGLGPLLYAALETDGCFVPLGPMQDRSPEVARELAQELVLKFGQLLRWWPMLTETVRGLRQEGQRSVAPV